MQICVDAEIQLLSAAASLREKEPAVAISLDINGNLARQRIRHADVDLVNTRQSGCKAQIVRFKRPIARRIAQQYMELPGYRRSRIERSRSIGRGSDPGLRRARNRAKIRCVQHNPFARSHGILRRDRRKIRRVRCDSETIGHREKFSPRRRIGGYRHVLAVLREHGRSEMRLPGHLEIYDLIGAQIGDAEDRRASGIGVGHRDPGDLGWHRQQTAYNDRDYRRNLQAGHENRRRTTGTRQAGLESSRCGHPEKSNLATEPWRKDYKSTEEQHSLPATYVPHVSPVSTGYATCLRDHV